MSDEPLQVCRHNWEVLRAACESEVITPMGVTIVAANILKDPMTPLHLTDEAWQQAERELGRQAKP